jgi:hypothetical protein
MRFHVDRSELERIRGLFKERGMMYAKIRDTVGRGFHYAYHYGYQMSEESKQKIEDCLGIKIEATPEINVPFEYPRSDRLAEMFGILLGDGNITSARIKGVLANVFSVSLNAVDEKEYVDYVKRMLIEMFGKCSDVPNKKSKCIRLFVRDTKVVHFLLRNGLMSGDKVKNQVNVPGWIKEKGGYEIACLRGLVDTDGCVYVLHKGNAPYVKIHFSNRSIPLLNDFVAMCKDIDIHSTISGHDARISSILDVRKFIEIVQPFKWKMIEERVKNDEELRRKYIDEYKPTRLVIDRESLEKLVREKPMKQVARELGFNIDTLMEKCKSFGIENPGKGYWSKLSQDEIVKKRRFNISREELERIVWEVPTERIAEKYGVSDSAIGKRCKRLGIEKPGRGYWAKQYAMKDK